MSIFDIMGPVMVGPSSSHTAGACRLGLVARNLMGEKIIAAKINLFGSFLLTGRGHGTDKALVAGLLGFKTDDLRIPDSFRYAAEEGLAFEFGEARLKEANPNTVEFILTGESGRVLEVVGASIGGGRINIEKIDGIITNFSGDYPTLIIRIFDQPGHVAEVTSMLAGKDINIANMQMYRNMRGGEAVMVIECDQEVPDECILWLKKVEGVKDAAYLSLS
jgi:L-serine dehydratase